MSKVRNPVRGGGKLSAAMTKEILIVFVLSEFFAERNQQTAAKLAPENFHGGLSLALKRTLHLSFQVVVRLFCFKNPSHVRI